MIISDIRFMTSKFLNTQWEKKNPELNAFIVNRFTQGFDTFADRIKLASGSTIHYTCLNPFTDSIKEYIIDSIV